MLGIKHEIAGSIIGLIFSFWIYLIGHPLIALGCFLLSIWGASLPDLIDPATSPFHRSLGHNWVSFFMFLTISILGLSLSLFFKQWFFILPTAFSIAFLSHLILDLMTPMGLPLFTGKSLLGILEIPLYLVPWVNLIILILTIYLTIRSIKYVVKKIGGPLAMILIFIPVWGSILLTGLAFWSISWLKWASVLFLLMFVITLFILFLIGKSIENSIKKKKR